MSRRPNSGKFTKVSTRRQLRCDSDTSVKSASTILLLVFLTQIYEIQSKQLKAAAGKAAASAAQHDSGASDALDQM